MVFHFQLPIVLSQTVNDVLAVFLSFKFPVQNSNRCLKSFIFNNKISSLSTIIELKTHGSFSNWLPCTSGHFCHLFFRSSITKRNSLFYLGCWFWIGIGFFSLEMSEILPISNEDAFLVFWYFVCVPVFKITWKVLIGNILCFLRTSKSCFEPTFFDRNRLSYASRIFHFNVKYIIIKIFNFISN